jgi:hypothetical protein
VNGPHEYHPHDGLCVHCGCWERTEREPVCPKNTPPLPEFRPFQKLPRLSRAMTITEKIDGTNAQVFNAPDGRVLAGSRTRWLVDGADNYGFAAWVKEHEDELRLLGPGQHFGEWWGQGIQRRYGLTEKRFSLFNGDRYEGSLPSCCRTVPVLYRGEFSTGMIDAVLQGLAVGGSVAAPGFMNPEGIVVFHHASRQLFKKTLGDDGHKGAA